MFVGHLAAALATRRVEPRLGLGATVAAAFGLDLLWPVLLLLGAETLRIAPDTAFTHLAFDSYPWSHSLLTVFVWSGVTALVARAVLGCARRGLILGALVLSHWALDLVVHRPDLPLWPGGPVVGLGLWNSIPGTILVEGGLLAGSLWLYVRMTSPRDRIGRWAFYSFVALLTVIWISQPWSPPPPSARVVAAVGLSSWLLPPWAAWFDRHRSPSASTATG